MESFEKDILTFSMQHKGNENDMALSVVAIDACRFDCCCYF